MGLDKGSREVNWRILASETIQYDDNEEVDMVAKYNKTMSLWKYHSQAINRNLCGVVDVEPGSEEFERVTSKIPEKFKKILKHDYSYISIRKMLARELPTAQQQGYEISYEETSEDGSTISNVFFPVSTSIIPFSPDYRYPHVHFPYKIVADILNQKELRILIYCDSFTQTKTTFLEFEVFPHLVKWLRNVDPKKESIKTNNLINSETYTARYGKLKSEVGKRIIEKWTEKTDPMKHVPEDCGIASYLMETFERLGQIPRCFVDLGCGNGLLVQMLKHLGVNGVGLDVRRRKLWDILQSDGADLREVSIDPTAESTGIPPEADFLIGNHSDELTPWIPVLAARLKCNFLVIPCCPYDYHGKFHVRPGKFASSYDCFLNFVRRSAERIGFIVESDRLSIPSSRRFCFIGRIPLQGLPNNVEELISLVTQPFAKCQEDKSFKARPAVIPIRNCSTIPKEIQRQLALKIFNFLLNASDKRVDGWRTGGNLPLSDMMELLTPEEKSYMKQQHGGIQTFIRNHYQWFNVRNGCVEIRNFKIQPTKKTPKGKQITPCVLHSIHPDGCPYGAECWFTHDVEVEMKQ